MIPRIRLLQTLTARELASLSDVLIDCVAGGASVSFMHPMTRAKAETFWRDVAASVARGERALIVAEGEHGDILGTVQVIWASPENQPHRGPLAQHLPHPPGRRGGPAHRGACGCEKNTGDGAGIRGGSRSGGWTRYLLDSRSTQPHVTK